MFALKSTSGGIPTYARFVLNQPRWVSVENSTKFSTRSGLMLHIMRSVQVSGTFVEGPLEIAELEYEEGKMRYRLTASVKNLRHEVFSSNGRDSYIVRVNEKGDGSCTCPDWQFRHSEDGTSCKHMRAALSGLPTMRGHDVWFDIAELDEYF